MRIKSLRIKNHFLGWEFEEINFISNLTLLVGGSGVGKTQILNAINDLKKIANGTSINGLEWSIIFSIDSGEEYKWEGKFESKDYNEVWSTDVDEKGFNLVFEKLTSYIDEGFLFERNPNLIVFRGKTLPKLSSIESMMHILAEEEEIKKVVSAFNKIKLKDNTRKENTQSTIVETFLEELKQYKKIEYIKNLPLPITAKLYLCQESKRDIFYQIENRFKDIFPQIEAVQIRAKHSVVFQLVELTIYIKEKGVPKWIKESRISSGMLRTLIHIAELYLSSNGSVILIDEFENSLGVNCIDILTDDLIHENKSIQFIATSHHPYIINNIPYEYWKIVSRKGGKISVRNAAAHKLGKSKQAAFLQLTKILEKQAAAI